MANDQNGGSSFSWFLAGLSLGSLLGVLYAPRSGQQTREELVAGALGSSELVRQRSREAKRAAAEYVDRSKDQVNDYVNRGKEQVDHLSSKSREAVEAGRQKINEAYNQSRQAVAEQKEKFSAAYGAGKQAYVETTAPPVPQEELIPGDYKG
jgi:gas vesicle protein